MTPYEIRQAVDAILVDELELDAAKLSPETDLRLGLGLDSLDSVDLIVAIEKRFKLRITESEAQSIHTVADIYGRVGERLAAAGGSGA